MLIENYGFNTIYNNPLHCKLTCTGDKLQLKMLKEYLTIDSKKKNDKGYQPDLNAKSTVLLLMKTYELYKDELIDDYDIDDLLKFCMNHIDDGLLYGLPNLNSIDKEFLIIREIFEYITEIKNNYYNHDYPYCEPFDVKFVKNKNRNVELYRLFNANIMRDTLSYKLNKGNNEVLERMLDDYEKFRDTIFYRLENVDFYLESYINDPFTKLLLNEIWHVESKVPIYSKKTNSSLSLSICSNENLLELALNLSYQIENITVNVEYVNDDYEIKNYTFLNGELIRSGFVDVESKSYSLIERVIRVDDIAQVQYAMEIVSVNIGKLKIEKYLPIRRFSFMNDETGYNHNNTIIHHKTTDLLKYIYEIDNTNELTGLYWRLRDSIPMFYRNPENIENFKKQYSYNMSCFYLMLCILERKYKLSFDRKAGIELKDVSSNVKGKSIFKNKKDGKIITERKKIFKNK